MITRPFLAALALSLGLSGTAAALPLFTAPIAASSAAAGAATPSAWVDPPRAAASAKPDAKSAAPAPRREANAVPAPAPEETRPAPAPSTGAAATKPTVPQADAAPSPRKSTVRTARYANGEGATWKTGRNAYGFSGSFGGCRITGHAGPRGFTIDRAC